MTAIRRVVAVVVVVGLLLSSLPAEPQQPARAHHVALVFFATPVSDMAGPQPRERLARVFVDALRHLGYHEGRNLILERRSLEGRPERAKEIAAELVRLQVDVIVSVHHHITRAAKDATSSIPIVMVANAAPVEQGLVASLARPGGNVTGSAYDPGADEVDAKRLQLLKQLVPRITRVAYLGNQSSWDLPGARRAQAAAADLGLTLFHADLGSGDVAAALSLLRGRTDALLVAGGPATYAQRRRIIDFAAQNRLPASYGVRDAAEDGGFMSYGVNATELFRRAAAYVERILKGVKPGDLPVEQPTKFELIVNIKTARQLGITVPDSILLQADEVIR